MWFGASILVVVVMFGGLTIKRQLHEHACNSYRASVVRALGDGISEPAPSTAGLSAEDVGRVAAWRAGYRHQIETATAGKPAAVVIGEKQFLAKLWSQEVQGNASMVMAGRGC
jgi:hypothetical protein